jgi:hypothetical protein
VKTVQKKRIILRGKWDKGVEGKETLSSEKLLFCDVKCIRSNHVKFIICWTNDLTQLSMEYVENKVRYTILNYWYMLY